MSWPVRRPPCKVGLPPCSSSQRATTCSAATALTGPNAEGFMLMVIDLSLGRGTLADGRRRVPRPRERLPDDETPVADDGDEVAGEVLAVRPAGAVDEQSGAGFEGMDA